jgi:1-acyl-sn-glycerol-3-phosphate acyltransferase
MRFLIRIASIIRALFMPFILVLQTATMSAVGLFCTFVFNNRKLDTFIIRFWSKSICWLVGMRVHVTGLENIPEGGVLFVFNHQSLFDIPVVHAGIPKDFRFGAKMELFKIPIFGSAMKHLGALKIARGNRAEAIQVLEDAAQKMNQGFSYILAPEGTRQKEPQLGEFKSGPFIMAVQAQRPIVPLVINNIYKILPKKALLMNTQSWFCDIELKVLKPVNGAEFNFNNRDDFKDLVRDMMKREYRPPTDSR